MKNMFAFLVIGLLAALIYFTVFSDGLGKGPDITVKNAQGETFNLSKPMKPVLVTFWATSCPRCIKEMPELAKMKHALDDRFELVAVSMHYDPAKHVTQFIKAHHYPFIFIMDTDDTIAKAFGNVLLTPTSFLIAPNGKMVYHEVGEIPFDIITKHIKKLSPQQ